MKYFETLKGAANLLEVLKRYGIYIVLLVLIIFFSITSEHFLVSTQFAKCSQAGIHVRYCGCWLRLCSPFGGH